MCVCVYVYYVYVCALACLLAHVHPSVNNVFLSSHIKSPVQINYLKINKQSINHSIMCLLIYIYLNLTFICEGIDGALILEE